MSWIFWVIVLAWVVPFIMRKIGQPPRNRGQIPPRDRGYNRYGGYPGNPYPHGYQGGQRPPQQNPTGAGQPMPPPPAPGGNPGGNWWQQPIPPGTFPGQQAPTQQRTSQQRTSQQRPAQQRPAQQRPAQQQPPGAPQSALPAPGPDAEQQGYRARKLAELDQQFTDQKISLEEYMKARNEVMRG
ncbi:hypothetical protein [Sinomonas sp. P47F7]|uniref:hypothetical protein n=1 Tax=Sinomonas sp. P47F7 TaxID=3410987 RepID=UPI003BF5E642